MNLLNAPQEDLEEEADINYITMVPEVPISSADLEQCRKTTSQRKATGNDNPSIELFGAAALVSNTKFQI